LPGNRPSTPTSNTSSRIYVVAGEPEKELDQLEPLLRVPYVSTDWLKIDPNFDPLRKNSRFQKIVAAER